MPNPALMKGFEKHIRIFALKNYVMHEQTWRIVCLNMALTFEITSDAQSKYPVLH